MSFPHAQRGAIIAVTRQDAHIARDGAADHALGFAVKGAAVRCDYL
jgi:hypothetical protein